MPVRVKRIWGTATGYVLPPTITSPKAPQGMREYTGRDPYAVECQRAAADRSCNPR